MRKSKIVLVLLPALAALPCSAAETKTPGASADEILADWLMQDVAKDAKKCFIAKTGAALETKALQKVVGELGEAGKGFAAEMANLTGAGAPGSDARWRELYTRACRTRRIKRLAALRAKCSSVVFTKHFDMGGSHYAYTEGQSDAQAERHFRPGAALCILDVSGETPTVETLIETPQGVIRNPDVSYDGKRILFAWKKSDRQDDYHLYEMDAATRKVRQLTFGLGFADYEGCYLPDGDIVFNSTRCVQIVDCWWTEVSNLYTCDPDGRFLRRLSFDQVHTNYPQVLDDGRVTYTRWDYNDRGQLFPQPLFQMNPDGTAQTEYYGNNSWFPTTIAHARGIPGTGKVMAIATGHHTRQHGKLIVVDPTKGRQEDSGVTMLAPVGRSKAVRVDRYGQGGDQFQYPYPFSEEEFLVTYRPEGVRGPFAIYFMRADGSRELLARDAKISCNQPVPLAARRKLTLRPSTVDYTKKTGTYYVQDVYIGPGLKGIERGTVKQLRVVALEFRAAGVGRNSNRGPAGGALVSTPVAINNGTWDVKLVLGDVRVHDDGSAFFTVPARLPVYFQLLDQKNHVVQTMRSWSTLQPGENFSCVGCHENKNEISLAPGKTTLAMKAGAQPLKPFYGPTRGFSFIKEIQPILDKHCIRCHNDRSKVPSMGRKKKRKQPAPPLATKDVKTPATGDKDKKAFSLLSTANVDRNAGRAWSDSYLMLTQRGRPNKLVNWLNAQSIPPMLPPYFAGAHKSGLIAMHEKGHNKVRLSREEMDKIACWIDLLVPYCGDYTEANTWDDNGKRKYQRYLDKRKRMEAIEAANIQEMLTGKRPAGAPTDRAATSGYRNVALNPNDVQGKAKGYPHASSNSEYGNKAPYAAKNVIDGKTANRGHGGRYPSWGPDRREDLWLKIELAKTFEVDKIVLYIRADFPHDRHWHSATIEFSDGSKEKIKIAKTAKGQTFTFKKRNISWLRFTELVQKKPLGWCGLSEIEVWGRDVR